MAARADGELWTDPASGQDALAAFPATAGKSARRQGSSHLRLLGLHAVLAASPQWSLGDDVQDPACAPATAQFRPSPTGVVAIDTCQRKVQHAALKRRIQGHFNYFGVSGNFRSLLLVVEQAKRSWYKWLCRRSQRKRLTWERFVDLLRDFPLPVPRITVRIWGS